MIFKLTNDQINNLYINGGDRMKYMLKKLLQYRLIDGNYRNKKNGKYELRRSVIIIFNSLSQNEKDMIKKMEKTVICRESINYYI